MALKGASPEHEGEERPDRWPLSEELAERGRRWGSTPTRDLSRLQRLSAVEPDAGDLLTRRTQRSVCPMAAER